MGKWQKLGVFAFLLLSLVVLALVANIVFISQMHPYDCSDPANECSSSWLSRIIFAGSIILLWGLAGWLALRDWSNK